MSGVDTLVFYICELEDEINSDSYDLDLTDTQLFVLYDFENSRYAVYGSRESEKQPYSSKIKPFSFYFNHVNHVVNFIESVVDKTSRFSYSLYALKNLPIRMEDISFHLLQNFRKRVWEIVAFDDEYFSKKTISKYAQLTRQGYNDYEFSYDYDENVQDEEHEQSTWETENAW